MNRNHALGRRGEDLAADYLRVRLGLNVMARNWRCPDGEVDILALDGRRLVACEVKTRSSTRFGTPAEALDDIQASRVRAAALKWAATRRIRHTGRLRGDIIAILWPPHAHPRIRYYPNSF
jgi:putative endonuclease